MGIDVINLGAVATPVMYYATHTQGLDCGLMITGSHNPADYNGIKMVLAGKTLTQEHIDIIYNLVEAQQRIHGQGCLSQLDVIDRYQARIVDDIVKQATKSGG